MGEGGSFRCSDKKSAFDTFAIDAGIAKRYPKLELTATDVLQISDMRSHELTSRYDQAEKEVIVNAAKQIPRQRIAYKNA